MTTTTYDSAADADADRTQQKALLVALNAWDRALRREECGAWCIIGKQGPQGVLALQTSWRRTDDHGVAGSAGAHCKRSSDHARASLG
jgi:hypothetical protein